jgi:hypothetical protein
MTIGIFGDSYGDWNKGDELKFISWPYILTRQLGTECINLSQGGAAMYYSYKTFLDNHSQCDQVIFLLTNPGRYTKPVFFENIVPDRRQMNSLFNVEQLLCQKELSINDRQNLEYLKGWYISQNFQYDHTACDLLVEKIKNIRPDVVLVPCFEFFREKAGSPISLQDITDLQCKSLGLNLYGIDFIKQYHEKNMICHFTDIVNQFVAQQMIQSLQNGKWTCTLPDTFVHSQDVNYYYERKLL